MIELTPGEAESLRDFIEMYLCQAIRDNLDIDNIIWVENLCKVWRKCGGKRVDDEKEGR